MTKHIWLTRRGWWLLAAIAASFGVAMVNHSFFAAMLGWLALGFFLSSFVMSLFSLHGYKVRRGHMPNGVVGQLVGMPLEISRKGHLLSQPLLLFERLHFADSSRNICVAEWKGGRKQSVERNALAAKRGEYKLNAVYLRGGDPAGIFMRERRFDLPAVMLVYPRADKLDPVALFKYEAVSEDSEKVAGIIGGNQEFRSLRKYMPSDPMKLINWRSTAKYRKLMVREYELNTIVSIALFVDGQREHVDRQGDNFEALISRAAGILELCSGMRCSFTFVAAGFTPASIVMRPIEECRARVMYELAVMRPGSARLSALVEDVAPSLPAGTLIFCLSLSNDNPVLMKVTEELANRGMVFL